MKKVLLVILAAGSAAIASAQIQYGVKAGYNLATVTQSGSSNVDGLKSKSDFSGGLLASIPLFSSFYLQPEVMYSGQGTQATESGETVKLNYSYINVPVLFKYQHASGVFAETGPQVGFLLSAKAKADGVNEDVKSQSQSVDFSWAFGLGYKIPKMGLGIDARYNLGLTNITKDDGDEKVKNSVFQFGLFYLFGGK
jgi:hypothetical protein